MALSIFQAYINEVLREFLGRSVVAYIDDILIYSPSQNQHVRDVLAMLQTLLGNHLYCKAEKCEFHRKEVDFLGYAIQQGCVGMQPGKVEAVEAVKAWPKLLTCKALQRFLGFANFYRRFIRSFSSLARPLTDQLRGPVRKIKWTQEVDKAFKELKNTFATAPILQQPDPERLFMLEVEASEIGVGAVLSQKTKHQAVNLLLPVSVQGHLQAGRGEHPSGRTLSTIHSRSVVHELRASSLAHLLFGVPGVGIEPTDQGC
ncbi:hypothetical protein P4O66_003368 [Electrophorus voltai]|uniref:ribonuclease H n=1 Tax=Electrophorus voltai TaxID=2609070 RepID=A0AAD8YRG3_9TELE|nr:hypothetical protein P4O66_003368 [Electrophorus voltai]